MFSRGRAMEFFTVKVRDYSGKSAQIAYAKALDFYRRQGLEGAMFASKMGDSGLCLLYYTDTRRCWNLLMKYMYVELMTEEEIEAETLASSALSPRQLHFVYKDLARFFDEYESEAGRISAFGTWSYSEILKENLRYFCYYIAAADQALNSMETEIINTILGEDLSQEETLTSIENANVVEVEDREKLEEGTMPSFVIAVLADKYFHAQGEDSNFEEAIRTLFRCAAIRIATIDGEVTEEEAEGIDLVIDKLLKVASLAK